MMGRKKDGLVSKVTSVKLKLDGEGQYLPYCYFKRHQGVIEDENVCILRKCKYYVRLYIKN